MQDPRRNEYYQMSVQEVFSSLGTGRDGLTEEEAEKRLGIYKENVLQAAKRKGPFLVFLEQFKDLLVIILLISAAISMVSGSGESTIVIVAALVMNGILGTVQHIKAEKSLDSLRAMSAPLAKVRRMGRTVQIPSAKVVPGDFLVLEAGDLAPADARVIESYGLKTDESSLTGESEHVEKMADAILEAGNPAEQKNMVFSGSLVTSGRGTAVVVATGMQTEIGRIAALMNETKEKQTPLQVSLDAFSSRLAVMIMIICCGVFLLEIYRGVTLLESLMFAVALAVAAIPEALSSIVTIVQAMGTQKMAREHAIIKDLKAVESLGCVSVICSDKTGTLTQNRMTVKQMYLNGNVMYPSKISIYSECARRFLEAVFLNNDAVYQGNGLLGDPTETALLAIGEQIEEKRKGELAGQIRTAAGPRLFEIPFDSSRKRMSVCHQIEGKKLLFVKGAPDVLMKHCDTVLLESGVREFAGKEYTKAMEQNDTWSKQGLRVLAFAFRELLEDELLGERSLEDQKTEYEEHLIFLGLAAMMDPPRPESKPAVLSAGRAGIRTVMITGDHKVTAQAVASKIGILTPGTEAVSGDELNRMSEAELLRRLPAISVYSRVTPEHKIRIVDAFQKSGHITAMTGDGVNDAPALKKADIGIAMGQMGTEVAKEASSMILADDNFATIIKAVANGRNVYRNIKNAIQFLLSGNMAGILCVLYTSIRDLPMPFAPVHLLFINLVTDSLPALAIGMEPAEEDLLLKPPRDPKQGILTRKFLLEILLQGALIAAATMVSFQTGLRTGGQADASTMAFTTLTLARLFHGFNCRSEHSLFRLGFSGNLYSVGAFGAGTVLLLAVLFVPGIQDIFAAADLTGRQLLSVAIFAAIPTAVIQGIKTLRESVE